ncbi:unnamed protein product [Protopolystoma xenopodis]|uniref:Uncharacterized protein n=1 Tax=Protopolystoma xenopodis TaxID=117903 RepID=A0A3S5FH16_9PLAT|nr:unnamed protein product [Protopolystoma xenopodis]
MSMHFSRSHEVGVRIALQPTFAAKVQFDLANLECLRTLWPDRDSELDRTGQMAASRRPGHKQACPPLFHSHTLHTRPAPRQVEDADPTPAKAKGGRKMGPGESSSRPTGITTSASLASSAPVASGAAVAKTLRAN